MTSNVFSQPVVAGVDGSSSSLHAACWAADEAARRRAPLRLVHAVSVATLAYTGGFAAPQRFAQALQADGRRRLDEVKDVALQEHPDLRVEVDLRTAGPVPALIEESGSARLMVLGSRGLGGFSGILVGSTAVALAAHGHCPVAVVRGSDPAATPRSHGSVVVGVDGSPTSESALAMAFEEASLRGADLVAVHSWIEFVSDSVDRYAHQYFDDWDALEIREHEVLAERLAGWQEKYPEVRVRRVVSKDRPVRCLLEQSAYAQLLVVGTQGRGGFTGMLLGSTSQALIYHAPCPLLVVPLRTNEVRTG